MLTLTLRLASSSTGTVDIPQVPLQKIHLISFLHRSPHVLRLRALVLGNNPPVVHCTLLQSLSCVFTDFDIYSITPYFVLSQQLTFSGKKKSIFNAYPKALPSTTPDTAHALTRL